MNRMRDRILITPEAIVERLKQHAEWGYYTGLLNTRDERAYFQACSFGWRESADRGTRLIFTRDVGHHTSGWFKNPDYERCRHLSLSFWRPAGIVTPQEPLPHDHAAAREWCRRFFGDARRWLWIEPPYSAEGKRSDVYHYRLFCDLAWQPIKPRGEVYTKDFIEKGWKSFSELHADDWLRDAEFGMGDPS